MILAASFKLFAAPVDPDSAKKIALNFIIGNKSLLKNAHLSSIELELYTRELKSFSKDNLYVFNFTNSKGFIIVSADDRIFPILGYSFENSFGNESTQPDAMKEWLENTNRQIAFILDKKLNPEQKTKEAWKNQGNISFKNTKNTSDVSPLIKTRWNQGKYYNSLCPVGTGGDDGHVWVGCVAVAMAQVMKYWNYPSYGSGQHSYNCSPYGIQSADFASTYYDWASMPNSLNSPNNAVATFLYHSGVSVNMGYAPGGSGAYMGSVVYALKKYFDYSKDIQILYKSTYTNQEWDSIIRHELDLSQPVAMAGGNHAFVIDGYQGSDYFHVNWGWGGSYDGYFYFSALNPGSSNFTSGQQAIVNVKPNCGQSQNNLLTLSDLSGVIIDNGGLNNNYMNCSATKTLIAPAGVSKVKLIFSSFKTVEGQDTLYVFDGQDDKSPLISALSGNLGSFEIMSNGTKVFLLFRSNDFTTDSGYVINYISAFDDTGVTGLISPADKTCGLPSDSVSIIVKNFGINTKSNIPVTVKVKTPKGTETYNKTLVGPLKTFESDTLFIRTINTTAEGNYYFTSYTRTTGDNLNRLNDTTKTTVNIKEIAQLPFVDTIGYKDYKMGDWLDYSQMTWVNSEREGGNLFFRTYAGSGEGGTGGIGGRNSGQFLIHNRKIGTVTSKMKLYFDYRVLGWGQIPMPIELNDAEKIHVLVSGDCGDHFDTVFTISSGNHADTTEFCKLEVPLGNYSGQNIIIGFATEWDDQMAYVDYDNFLVVDSSAQVNGVLTVNTVKPDFLIYPNPTSGIFKVQKINSSQEALELSVYDISGKKVKSQIITPKDKELIIDIENEKSGVYFIQVRTNDKMLFGKVLKE